MSSMKSNGSSLKTRVEQSIVDYACSLRSERRKALLKVLVQYVPEKHRVIALTCPDLYKRLFLNKFQSNPQHQKFAQCTLAHFLLIGGSIGIPS